MAHGPRLVTEQVSHGDCWPCFTHRLWSVCSGVLAQLRRAGRLWHARKAAVAGVELCIALVGALDIHEQKYCPCKFCIFKADNQGSGIWLKDWLKNDGANPFSDAASLLTCFSNCILHTKLYESVFQGSTVIEIVARHSTVEGVK